MSIPSAKLLIQFFLIFFTDFSAISMLYLLFVVAYVFHFFVQLNEIP